MFFLKKIRSIALANILLHSGMNISLSKHHSLEQAIYMSMPVVHTYTLKTMMTHCTPGNRMLVFICKIDNFTYISSTFTILLQVCIKEKKPFLFNLSTLLQRNTID